MTIKELKDYCRKYKIKGYSKLKKAELLKLVNKHKTENKQKLITKKNKKEPTLKELQFLAKYHKIKNRSKISKQELINRISLYTKSNLTPKEWEIILGEKWEIKEAIGNIKVYSYYGIILIGNLSDLKKSTLKKEFKNSILIEKNITYKNLLLKYMYNIKELELKINKHIFRIKHIHKIFKLLGLNVTINQHKNGPILLKTQSKFAILAPIRYEKNL